jgi:murein DD-endopeptidase MepM/ murein hydrolase activator NlpD
MDRTFIDKEKELKSAKRSLKPILLILLVLLVCIPLVWIFIVRMEGAEPSLRLDLESSFIGKSREITVTIEDAGSGVRKVWMSLLANGKEVEFLQRTFPSAGFHIGGTEKSVKIKTTISPEALNLKDGKGVLRIAAWDYSLRKWGKGNRVIFEKEIQIDTKPPMVELVSRAHNINQGGAGVAIYRLSEKCPLSGVSVGDRFYPGHEGYFKDAAVHMAFFALDYQQGKDVTLLVEATDEAGNRSAARPVYHINSRKFRKDAIKLSDRFLQEKMVDFERYFPEFKNGNPKDLFLKVNRELRQKNTEAIYAVTKDSTPEIFWEGAFLRLPRSANRAQFADHRTYFYKGKVIDRQVHMGIDLASTSQSPIPAANHGKVVLSGDQGIYGNTVILDHGFGLFSLYSHLSAIAVEKGSKVKKGEIIGTTGKTGMAGGDHLHYGMLVHQTYVNPLEWWDAEWIRNNIKTKIDTAGPGQK